MMMTKAFALAMLLAACSGKQSDSTPNTPPPAGGCEAVRGKVEQLYRVEAQAKEPQRVDDAVADNTRMVMVECARAPAPVSACVAGAATVADIETRCLAPLDDEGTETDVLRP